MEMAGWMRAEERLRFRFLAGGFTIRPMPYRLLADFVEELENAGDLVRIAAQVDPELELAEIVAQAAGESRNGGPPALLFQNVKGCRPAVAVNLLGTAGRIRRALGVDSFEEMAARMTDCLVGQSAGAWFERLKWSRPAGAERWQPKFARSGACQQVVRLAGFDLQPVVCPEIQRFGVIEKVG